MGIESQLLARLRQHRLSMFLAAYQALQMNELQVMDTDGAQHMAQIGRKKIRLACLLAAIDTTGANHHEGRTILQ